MVHELLKMRRSVRLAAKTISEVSSQTSNQIVGPKARSKSTKGGNKTNKDSVYKKSIKRNRETSSTSDCDENECKESMVNCSGIIEEKIKPKLKRVKTEQENSTVIASGNLQQPMLQGKLIGAHVSISGGIQNAVSEALKIGAKAFGLFLRSQRQWKSKPLEDKAAELFKQACERGGFSARAILPHGIYLMNCGSPEEETLAKSRETLVEELKRCEKLGLTLYNFHPGSTCGKITVEECIDRIAESINGAHLQANHVVTVLENMSCQGNTVGGKFEELREIIDRVKDKSRVGVCIDTCHAFAAGYDISSDGGFDKMMQEFESVIGLKYLRAVHLNDSKGELGCHLDRHENIGKGKIGINAFRRLMMDPRFNGIPMILETPCEAENTYQKEVKLLYSFLDGKS
ncbi:LOW QUALITY PROTEIN: probable endonuclease 4 [Acropora millepora]|uniref:LOW QUALITY PROTEIN: probable endonuclease 4 n=1 Tax=Acropora millepora TaxID=45264 RepID=UPI001CF581AC|nr:LOW QUALITY PROTEIN: probable endonuclease 4 [Acropora millepora]